MAYTTALLLLLAALAGAQKEPNQPSKVYQAASGLIAKLCQNSVGASDEDVKTVSHLQELTTESQKCLQYCVFQILGMQSGTRFSRLFSIIAYASVHVIEDLPRTLRASRIVDRCLDQMKGIKSDDKCYLAERYENCYRFVDRS